MAPRGWLGRGREPELSGRRDGPSRSPSASAEGRQRAVAAATPRDTTALYDVARGGGARGGRRCPALDRDVGHRPPAGARSRRSRDAGLPGVGGVHGRRPRHRTSLRPARLRSLAGRVAVPHRRLPARSRRAPRPLGARDLARRRPLLGQPAGPAVRRPALRARGGVGAAGYRRAGRPGLVGEAERTPGARRDAADARADRPTGRRARPLGGPGAHPPGSCRSNSASPS